jgi:hypothetical protein
VYLEQERFRHRYLTGAEQEDVFYSCRNLTDKLRASAISGQNLKDDVVATKSICTNLMSVYVRRSRTAIDEAYK